MGPRYGWKSRADPDFMRYSAEVTPNATQRVSCVFDESLNARKLVYCND